MIMILLIICFNVCFCVFSNFNISINQLINSYRFKFNEAAMKIKYLKYFANILFITISRMKYVKPINLYSILR